MFRMYRLTHSIACVLLMFAFAPIIVAHAETDAAIATDATVQTQGTAPVPRPFNLIRKAQEAKQVIQQNAFQAKQDLRVETRAALQGATTSGEKRDILMGAAKERVGIAKERIASSTTLRMNIKEAIRWHGGLIRERFVNAIASLKKFMTRIDSRIAKMKTAGVDVSSVTTLETSANTAIATAETDIAAVKAYIESVSDTSDRATVKAELDVKIKKAQESIHAAHEAVRKVVKALVELSVKNKPAASLEVDAGATTTTATN